MKQKEIITKTNVKSKESENSYSVIIKSYLKHLNDFHHFHDTADTVFDLIALSETIDVNNPEFVRAIELTLGWFNSKLNFSNVMNEGKDQIKIYGFIVLLFEAINTEIIIDRLLENMVGKNLLDQIPFNKVLFEEKRGKLSKSTYDYFINKFSYTHYFPPKQKALIESKLEKLLDYSEFKNKFDLIYSKVNKLQQLHDQDVF